MPPKFFITHSWHDIEFVRCLFKDLKAHGVEGWMDDTTVRGGQRLAEEINRGLEDCEMYLPVFSPAALESPWCWEEINAAIALANRPGRNRKLTIIPVIAAKCEIPALLSARLYFDFTANYDDALKGLLSKGFGIKTNVVATHSVHPTPIAFIEDKQSRASTIPRLYAPPKSSRRSSSKSVIVVSAIVIFSIILMICGGYFLFSNVLSAISNLGTTPTEAIAVIPTMLPSRIALINPPDTPLNPTTTPIVTDAPIIITATPTKRIASPTVPKGSPTLNVPAGVYALKLETDPAKLTSDPSVIVAFKLTIFNSTGSTQLFRKWFVRVFQCPEQCQDFKNSYGESLKADVNVATGTSVIITSPHVHFGPGRCDYIAVPYYTDVNDQATQFQTTKGGGLFFTFSICQ